MKRSIPVLGALLLAIVAAANLGFVGSQTPRELGQVDWQRDLDAALERSGAGGKPVFAFFQEVPGCATCVNFGEQVLEHPLLVEAIESEFEPVLVYNNRPGRDARWLARFDEPSWNNPVVRFLDGDGRDWIPRRAGVWSPYAIGLRMVETLQTAERPVPAYLTQAVAELRPRHEETALLGMYCYWSGEACLGEIEGVISSRTGALDGSEVVELRFDPERVSYEELLTAAKRRGCAERVFTRNAREQRVAAQVFPGAARETKSTLRPARDRDQKYYLKRSPWRELALTPAQALRVNAAAARGADATPFLSPRQRAQAGG